MEDRPESNEPAVTDRDLALLMMSEDSLVALGAMLGFRARTVPGDLLPMGFGESRPS
ncbi:MAG: hypothetical protein ACKO2K_20860 [Alphaproteobacteria bacterium]